VTLKATNADTLAARVAALPDDVGDGLTKREWYAGLAMQGLMTDSTAALIGGTPPQLLARVAVAMADALVEALEEERWGIPPEKPEQSHGEGGAA
jgi:hypothetical protein